ncbi:MAG TPA: lysophospholipid acyltransferase family protein [Ramlibacter sp.]|uniref:lysophospholipid acyltransferase family protein n=1 Tax=Ramlibacter sp. TaxID=1917967 RepID=UPI002C8F4517|nr:lysophospholipid acyltransferase family protein [Ramlibacter sp.]HVZ43890.1 lysophospholipid acyltransferase family protein [Ramlibacter sp.]
MGCVPGLWRILRALVHAVGGWFTIRLVFPRLAQAEREARVQAWAVRMLAIMGIGLELRGTPPVRGPVLLVANHLSWLDIVVLHASRYCRFVSKADVKRWPVIGTLATGAGTLYIERERRRHVMHVVHRMAESLRDGEVVAVFPEGTTGDGTGVLPFHANLMQAAISADVAVQPVALSFVESATGERCGSPLYLGDETLVGSVWRTLTGPRFFARVSFGEPVKAEARDRRALAHAVREEVVRLYEERPAG